LGTEFAFPLLVDETSTMSLIGAALPLSGSFFGFTVPLIVWVLGAASRASPVTL